MKIYLENPQEWSKGVQSAFYEEFPFFINYPLKVEFVKKDYEKGYALGKITVTPYFIVPVIIDNFLLKDFDVGIMNGATIPLTPESIYSMMSNPSAFMDSSEKIKGGKVTRLFKPGLTYPEDWANQSMNGVHYTKTAMLPLVLPTMTKEAQQKIASFYSPHEASQFVINKTDGPLQDILTSEPAEDPDLRKLASDHIDRDRVYIHKKSRDKYTGYFMNSEVDDLIKLDLNEDEFNALEPKFAEAKELAEEKDAKLFAKKADMLRGSDGVITDGTTHIKIAIHDDLETDGEREIEGLGENFTHLKLTVTHVPNIIKVADDRYLIPKDFKFYELGLEREVVAEVDKTNRAIKDSTGRFTFQGPVFSKYASNGHKIDNVEAPDAYAMATQCGACAEDIVKMAQIHKGAAHYFELSELRSPVSMDEFMDKWAEISEHEKVELDIIHDNLAPLLKIAVNVNEARVVDKVLSLGLINDKNLKEFLDNIPLFESTAQYLAKLLLTVRLGERGIPEADVEDAMEALTRVIMHLKNIQSTRKNVKELAAK